TINGPGKDLLRVRATGNSRVFKIDDGVAGQSIVTIRGMGISGGSFSSTNIGNQNGGGILNREDLTLEGVSVQRNSVKGGSGAGIANEGGRLNVHDSEIFDNDDTSNGIAGGGIYSTGPLLVTGSIIRNNQIGGNSSASGGGIFSSGGAVIRHSTIAGNNAFDSEAGNTGTGGGIYAIGGLTLDHVVVADNTVEGDPTFPSYNDLFGAVTSTYSLIEDTSGATITDNGGTITGIDPQLTSNQTPGTGSILINTGDPAAVAGQGNVPLLDLDGNARIQSGRIDIGAIEVQMPPTLSITRHTPTEQITNADSLIFTASFDEAVTGVDAADFSVVGSTATITDVTEVSSSEYRITVSGGDLANLDAVVGLDLAASQNITDAGGTALPAGEPTTDETYTLDHTGPVATLQSPSSTFLSPANYLGTIEFSIADAATVASVGIGIRNLGTAGFWNGTNYFGNGEIYFPATQIPNTDRWTWNFDVANFVPQNYQFWVEATDGLGNRTSGLASNNFIYSDIITVDTTADESDGDFSNGDLSLREAIERATALANGPYTITFGQNLSGQTINLSGGQITIGGDLTIDGDLNNDGRPDITIDAGNGSDGLFDTADGHRIFEIDDNDSSSILNVEIRGLKLTGGDSASNGGAIRSVENLTVRNAVLTRNASAFEGGAISAGGTLSAIDSTLSLNHARSGGGIYAFGDPPATVSSSTIAQNFASGRGGGIFVFERSLNVINSTLSGNQANWGGGIWSTTDVSVSHSTIFGNSDTRNCDGLCSIRSYDIHHSIVADQSNINSQPTGSYNLFSTTVPITGTNNLQNTDPKLGPLQDNGGVTHTHAPASDSPAINAGDSSLVSGQNGVPLYDQRGQAFPRLVRTIDIGAFESELPPTVLSFARHTPTDQYTQADSLVFKATFDENVLRVDVADFEVTGTSATITGVTRLNGSEYLVTVSGGDLADLNSVVSLNLSVDQDITDLGGAGLENLEPAIDETYTVDHLAPVTALVSPVDAVVNPANFLGSIEVTVDDASPLTSVGIGIRNLGASRFWDGNAFQSTGETYFSATQVAGTNRWTLTFDVANFVPEDYQIWVEATDVLGQTSSGIRGATFTYSNITTVDNRVDESDGNYSNGDLSLREAIERVSMLNGSYTITFADSLRDQTIDVTQGQITIGGDLIIDGDLNNDGRPDITIDAGNGADGVFGTGDGSKIFRIFDGDLSSANRSVVIVGLILTGGDGTTSGGAIFTAEDLTVRDSVITHNWTQSDGGAISSSNFSAVLGELNVINSSLTNNTAAGLGGAVRSGTSVSFELADSLVASNSAREGGAIFNERNLTILNSTLSANSATNNGGAILNHGAVSLNHSTIFGNTATSGQAIYGIDGQNISYTIGHTIVGGTFFNVPLSGNHNLFAQSVLIDGTNNRQNIDPKLGPLQDNGGLTHTHAPLFDSPAINSGDESIVAGGSNGVPLYDQRGVGFNRVIDRIDIGAVENNAPTLLRITRQNPASEKTNADILTFRATFSEDVTGVSPADFLVDGSSNASIESVVSVDGKTYDVTIQGGTLANYEGLAGLNLSGENDIADLTGLSLVLGEPSIDESYSLENTAPVLNSFSRQTPGNETTNASTLVFRATFDEDVTGVDATDFEVDGNSTAAVSAVTQVGIGSYDVEVSGGDLNNFDGVVGLNLSNSNNITDLFGNALPNSEPSTEETYQVDTVNPQLLSITRQTPSEQFTNADSLTFAATFDEDVMEVGASDFVVSGVDPVTTATISNVEMVDARNYLIVVSGGNLASYGGTVGLDVSVANNITDTIGNSLPTDEPAIDETYTLDNAAPTLSILRQVPTSEYTKADTLVLRALFDEDVSAVDATDFVVSGDGSNPTTSATIGNVNAIDARTYDITISGGDLVDYNGTVGIDISNENNIVDLAGNRFATAEPNTDETYTVDNIAPEVVSFVRHSPPDLHTTSDSLTFRLTFNEDVVGVEASDFLVQSTGPFGTTTATVTSLLAVNDRTYDVTVSGGDLASYIGPVRLTIPFNFAVNAFEDLAGNGIPSGPPSEQYNVNATTLQVLLPESVDPFTNADSLVFEAVVSQELNGVDASDFIVEGGSTATVTNVSRLNGLKYELTVSGGDLPNFNGSVKVGVAPSHAVTDAQGDPTNLVQNLRQSYSVDNVQPTFTGLTRLNPLAESTNADVLVFRATPSGEQLENVDISDFIVAGATTATVTQVVLEFGSLYKIIVSGGDLATFNGEVGIDISPSSDITDRAGNQIVAAEPPIDETFTVDNIGPQVESIAFEDGSDQRSVIRSVTVDFDSEVVVDADAFLLTTSDGTVVTLAAPVLSIVNGKTRAVLTFSGDQVDASGSLIDGDYRLNVLSDKIRDRAGNAFDGDRDGTAGGDVVDSFFRLYGDSDGDRDVD
ncbi:MAG: choice-of-anchor Q domain-containing protein, partial [Planctomycetota bacterium]